MPVQAVHSTEATEPCGDVDGSSRPQVPTEVADTEASTAGVSSLRRLGVASLLSLGLDSSAIDRRPSPMDANEADAMETLGLPLPGYSSSGVSCSDGLTVGRNG